MTAYSTDTADLLFVGVPEGTKYFSVEHHKGVETKFANTLEYGEARNKGELLFIPEGYSLLSAGTADGVSEEDAGKVCTHKNIKKSWDDKISIVWVNHESTGANNLYVDTATESFLSLLRSLNINPSETVVLYKLKN